MCLLNRLASPHGESIRKLIGTMLLLIGIARMLQLGYQIPSLGWTTALIYGLLQITVGLALLQTNGEIRHTFIGRLVAACCFSLAMTMATDFLPVYTASAVYVMIGWSMMGEILHRKVIANGPD